jgi:hypothetical protein
MSDSRSAQSRADHQCYERTGSGNWHYGAGRSKPPSLLKGLSALTQLRPFVRSAGNQSTEERMNELAREMITLKPGDPMRTRIVQEIIRLSDSFKPANAPGSYAPGS